MMTYWISNPSLKIVIIMWGWCSVITIVGSKTSIRPRVSLASVTLKCYGRWLLVPHGVVCFLSNVYYLAFLTISFARPLTKRQCALIEACAEPLSHRYRQLTLILSLTHSVTQTDNPDDIVHYGLARKHKNLAPILENSRTVPSLRNTKNIPWITLLAKNWHWCLLNFMAMFPAPVRIRKKISVQFWPENGKSIVTELL